MRPVERGAPRAPQRRRPPGPRAPSPLCRCARSAPTPGASASASVASKRRRVAEWASQSTKQQPAGGHTTSASGRCSPTRSNPSTRVVATCSHRSTGGLSIETVPPGSSAPKKKLCQSCPYSHGRVVEDVAPSHPDLPQSQRGGQHEYQAQSQPYAQRARVGVSAERIARFVPVVTPARFWLRSMRPASAAHLNRG